MTTGRALDELARAHLVERDADGRFRMHDLLRAYARSLPDADEAAEAARLYHYYEAAAAAAVRILYPAEADRLPRIEPPATELPPFDDAATALAWLDRESPTLQVIAARTADNNPPGYAARLAVILQRYLDSGRYTDALRLCEHGLRAARLAGDAAAEAGVQHSLGLLHFNTGRVDAGIVHGEAALLVLYRQVGDELNAARILNLLGNYHKNRCHYQPALDAFGEALVMFRRIGYRQGVAGTMANMGAVLRWTGRPRQAVAFAAYALGIFHEADDALGTCVALHNLGLAQAHLGRLTESLDTHRQATAIVARVGHLLALGATTTALGTAHALAGDHAAAIAHHEEALAISRSAAQSRTEATALNGLADVARWTGRHDDALDHYRAARAVARHDHWRAEEAYAEAGLGLTYAAMEDPDRAAGHHATARRLNPFVDVSLAGAEPPESSTVLSGPAGDQGNETVGRSLGAG